MELSDSVEIQAPPTVVYDWFCHLDQHYLQWHPDHRDCYWLKGRQMEIGAELVAIELLHGSTHKLHFRITDIEPGRRVEFRLLGPPGLLIPRGVFSVVPTDLGCRFTATLYPRLGHLLRLLMPGRVKALITHQAEEGQNLKRIIEHNT